MEKKTPPRLTRSSSPVAHLQRHNKNSIAGLALPLNSRAPSDAQNYEVFIMALFSRMKSSIWHNIIPFDPNDVSDMSTSMGQRWELVLPLLFNANYVLFKRSHLSINVIKWQNICLLLEGDDMIQIVSFRPRGKKMHGMSAEAYRNLDHHHSKSKILIWQLLRIVNYTYQHEQILF